MKVSYQWLKDYVSINIPPEKLAHRLTMAGLEVEKIDNVSDDSILELEITPNRPDCLSMLGVAREVSAILNVTLKVPKVRRWRSSSKRCDITISDKEGCLRYVGAVIRDVEIKKAPAAMQKKLSSLGLRPINNIVDITNFCLMETGQPLHAFDYDKLEGGRIIVRLARKGEKIVTIDGEERELDSSILVIADARRPVAIAGVMGGLETEVTESTKNILLESACFDPLLVRRASRKLGLGSESSYRFERGVDINGVEGGALRAATLIKEYAGGDVEKKTDLVVSKKGAVHKPVGVRLENINALLGSSLPAQRIKNILKKLGFRVSVKNTSTFAVTPPSFRGDIKIEEDIIEEVARIVGYDNLPLSLPSVALTNVPPDKSVDTKQALRQSLTGQGFSEAITYAMTSEEKLNKTDLVSPRGTEILNPLSKDQELMRPSMLPNLLAVVQANLNRGQQDIRLFEIGKTYRGPHEKDVLALVMACRRYDDWRLGDKQQADFFDLKGVLQHVCERMDVKGFDVSRGSEEAFEAGIAAEIQFDKRPRGVLGKLSSSVLRNWDIKSSDVYYAQLDLGSIKDDIGIKQFDAPSEYPSVTRDVSIAVNKDVPFESFRDIALKEGSGLLSEIQFLEEYLGEKISSGQRGLLFSLTYQSKERTLTEDEVNKVHARICRAYTEDLDATMR